MPEWRQCRYLFFRDEELLVNYADDEDFIDDDDVKTLKNPTLEELSPGLTTNFFKRWIEVIFQVQIKGIVSIRLAIISGEAGSSFFLLPILV